MSETGYIRDELDLKFLILTVLSSLNAPVGFYDLVDTVMIGEAPTLLECADACYSLLDSGHAAEVPGGIVLSEKGREALAAYGNRLPASVRREAQKSALRAMARLRRDALIKCETVEKNGALMTELSISDGIGKIMSLEMLVATASQAALLESNFKANAEAIYNSVLETLLRETPVGGGAE